ncbi:DEAD/DEAH box helicase [Leucothrix pacifica]|uniref:Helicase SNF2 n=1 Tax=Leucothrix pacifica TaxID=1247513 RepID=A0A317CEB3_9GAMM|nr:DEAD/DEAH box helicase [Leucothrix pacifica]PWQ95653.1 hypothetical protein DKW60_14655 [Leucothrix pacifica]
MIELNESLLTKFGIDIKALHYMFGRDVVDDGADFFYDHDVEIYDVTDIGKGNLRAKATVSEAFSAPLSTTLFLKPQTDGKLMVSSSCTCDDHRNCLHGIAVLYSFFNTLLEEHAEEMSDGTAKSDAETQRVNQWLNDVGDQEAGLPSPFLPTKHLPDNQSSTYDVVYLLKNTDLHSEPSLKVIPKKVRRLKSGGYGKPANLRSYEVGGYSSSGLFYEAVDEEIIKTLNAFCDNPYSSTPQYLLSGDMGEFVLQQILSTQRCFWEEITKTSIPLRQGTTMPAVLEWLEDDGYLRSSLVIDHPDVTLFQLTHFYYVDKLNHQCGLLDHPNLNPLQMVAFLNAPPVPVELAQQVSEQLLELFPTKEVPLPTKLDITNIDISDVTPRLSLHLHSEMISNGHRVHLAGLSFIYQDATIIPHSEAELSESQSVRVDGAVRYRISRDLASESVALQTLKEAGFHRFQEDTPKYGVLNHGMLTEPSLEYAVEKWGKFLDEQVPILREQGWEITFAEDFLIQITKVDEWHAELESDDAGEWFELALGFELDGQRINLLPLLVDLLANTPDTALLREMLQAESHRLFQIGAHQWVKLPTDRLLNVLDTLIELYDADTLNAAGNLEFSRHEGMHYGNILNDAGLQWKGAKELKQLHERLKEFDGIQTALLPDQLQATLRDYQQRGYDWMSFMRDYQFNGILADDMGLGKTIQALSLLLSEKENQRAQQPSLIIAPTSLMSNWKNEAQRFTPDLNVLVLQGADRKTRFAELEQADIAITTYPLIVRDAAFYQEKSFHYVILDEAQAIKNPRAKATQQICQLKTKHRLCLTGTPVENHLGELWSMFHFLMPGYLGPLDRFNRLFRNPIEKQGDTDRSKQLQKRVKPFMLRRTKNEVAVELPEKTEIVRTVALSGKQRDLYETVRLAMDKKVRDEIKKKGLSRSHIMILDALLKLRQVCCDPRLVKLDKAKKVKTSAKLELLMEMLPEMVESGNKILLFSQFTTMLGLIEDELKRLKISYSKLTGQTRKRAEAIEAFQEGDAAVFLISLKAGGTGLNLTAADTVIHYDPWWNPAVEQQATDRAYRIGQDKPVFVYKLLTEETVEEKILALQAKKQQLADNIYKGGDKAAAFDQGELMALLQPLE